MTLDQLRIFVGVAEREHVTRAAEALNISQSAASAAIAALEERHQVKLFHRVGRRIALTDAGRVFLDEARAVLGRAAAAQRVLTDFSGLARGTLSLIASQTIAAYWLPPILAEYRRAHPGVAVDVAIGNSEQAAARVGEGAAELGFIEGALDDPALARWRVAEDRMALVCREAPEGPIDRSWLLGRPWVLREPGSGTRSTFEAALGRLDLSIAELEVALELPSNEAVRTAVEHGAGCGALSTLVVAPSIALGRLAAVPFEIAPRAFYALRHKERHRSKAAEALTALIARRG